VPGSGVCKNKGVEMKTKVIPQKAEVDDLFDFIDLLYEIIDLFNVLFQAIYNLGQLLNGESPTNVGL